jgi:hypothetical protein
LPFSASRTGAISSKWVFLAIFSFLFSFYIYCEGEVRIYS